MLSDGRSKAGLARLLTRGILAAAICAACSASGCSRAKDPALAAAERGNEAVRRGDTSGDQEEYRKAIAEFDEAIRLKPDLDDAYCNRGVCFAKLNQYDKAAADLREALRINPDNATAAKNLTMIDVRNRTLDNVDDRLAKIRKDRQTVLDQLHAGQEPSYKGHSLREWIQFLKGDDELMRIASETALSEIDPDGGNVVPALIEALQDKHQDVRTSVAQALFYRGINESAKKPTTAIPALIDALKDGHPKVREKAAMALLTLGPEAKSAVKALTQAQKDEAPEVRDAATAALKRINPGAEDSKPEK
jgi:tetratricopeptide (TPR) repeat protein